MISKRMKDRAMNADSSPGFLAYLCKYMKIYSGRRRLRPASENYSVNKDRKVSSETATLRGQGHMSPCPLKGCAVYFAVAGSAGQIV